MYRGLALGHGSVTMDPWVLWNEDALIRVIICPREPCHTSLSDFWLPEGFAPDRTERRADVEGPYVYFQNWPAL